MVESSAWSVVPAVFALNEAAGVDVPDESPPAAVGAYVGGLVGEDAGTVGDDVGAEVVGDVVGDCVGDVVGVVVGDVVGDVVGLVVGDNGAVVGERVLNSRQSVAPTSGGALKAGSLLLKQLTSPHSAHS